MSTDTTGQTPERESGEGRDERMLCWLTREQIATLPKEVVRQILAEPVPPNVLAIDAQLDTIDTLRATVDRLTGELEEVKEQRDALGRALESLLVDPDAHWWRDLSGSGLGPTVPIYDAARDAYLIQVSAAALTPASDTHEPETGGGE